jgi:hypothetical protein
MIVRRLLLLFEEQIFKLYREIEVEKMKKIIDISNKVVRVS